jgi:hypothetical protein
VSTHGSAIRVSSVADFASKSSQIRGSHEP